MEWRYVKDIDCMVTTEEIAQIEGTSPAFVRKLVKHKILRGQVRGRGLKISKSDYLAYRELTAGYYLASEEDMITFARLKKLS